MKFSKQESLIIFLLVVIYIVGIIGICLPIHPDFVRLTPINLLVSVGLMLWNHNNWSSKQIFVCCFAFIFGFLAEAHGTNYGLIFGNYKYGTVMGWQFLNTPISAGLLWLIVTYGVGCLMNIAFSTFDFLMKALLGALILVSLDMLIEPVAIHLNFWQWQNNVIPKQNYFGWYIVGFLQLAVFTYFLPNVKNKIGVVILLIQFLFFALIIGFLELWA